MKQTATFSLRAFAREHDDLPAFHAAYLLLTFIAAGLFNLGFFALLIVGHMCLDVFKYRDVHRFSWARTVEGVIRESLIDVTLLCMGLVFAIYLHPSLSGLLGIKGIMLAELTILRGVGMMTPKLKILYEFLKILSHVDLYLTRLHPKIGKKLSLVEYVCLLSICVALGLLIGAPIILELSDGHFLKMFLEEMTPWRI